MTKKTCSRCKIEKDLEEFGKRSNRDVPRSWCKNCENEYGQLKHAANPTRWATYQRDKNRHLRMEVILSYGSECACCGEARYEFLTIDHVNGGGTQQRRELGNSSMAIARWLKKNNYPEGYQILCFNCNCAKGASGYCPHVS